MVRIKEYIAPAGCEARPGYKLVPVYITIHNTGNSGKGAGAENHGRYLQGTGAFKTVSWHYAVDDGLIVRCIPENENAWHAGDGGSGTGNRQSLAIEICENPESNLAKATDNAAELAARLMHDYKIPLGNVVQHNRWNGKNCPHLIRAGKPYDWQAFLKKVQAFYEGVAQAPPEQKHDAPDTAGQEKENVLYAVQTGVFRERSNALAYAQSLREKGIDALVVKKTVALGGKEAAV